MFGIPFPTPDALRDYFQSDEEWERYAAQYQTWMESLEEEHENLIKPKKQHTFRCKACGKFMSTFETHIMAINGPWHMNSKCLERLMKLLTANKMFSFDRQAWSVIGPI